MMKLNSGHLPWQPRTQGLLRAFYRPLFALAFGLIASFNAVQAQVATQYIFQQSSATYSAITGTTVHAAGWDNGVVNVTGLPNFNFNGTNYNNVFVHCDGHVSFGAAHADNTYAPISTAGSGVAGVVAAFSRDLHSGKGNQPITRQQVGNELVFQWSQVQRYVSTDTDADRYNAQIRLNTTNGDIKIHYGPNASASNNLPVQVGLRGANTADYNNRTTTANWSATTAGTANNATCTTTNTITPTANMVFTWARCNAPSSVTAAVVEDCGNSQFRVAVNITTVSSLPASVNYTVNGGAPSSVTANGSGTTTIGPFAQSAVVEVTVTYGSCPIAPTTFPPFFSNCPVTLDCNSVLTVEYCYKNNDPRQFNYVTDPGETITIRFLSPSPTLPGDEIFFQNPPYLSDAFGGGNGDDLSDLGEFVSDGNEARIRLQTNGSGSCQDLGLSTPWTFEVLCTPSCIAPFGSAFVTNDCANGQFSVDVSIDDPGDATTVGIRYTVDGGLPITLSDQALYDPINLGPFPITSSVIVVLIHEDEALCNLTLPLIVRDPFDPCTPDNDLCANAEVLAVNTASNCPGNQVFGSTFDSNNESGTPSCTGAGGLHDVWYSFTTGNMQSPLSVRITPTAISGVGHVGLEVYTPGCGGTLVGCYSVTLPTTTSIPGLAPYTQYRLRVFTNIANGAAGNFNICLSAPAAASTCGNTYQDHAGAGDYGNNRNDITYLCPSNPGEKVRLVFSQFNVAANDFLTIYNGPNTSSPVIGTYTGASLPPDALSSDANGCLTLKFTSDASVVAAGYTAVAYCCTLPLHTASITLDPACLGSDFNLFGVTNVGNIFAWTGPNGFTSSVQNPVIPSVTQAVAGTYNLTVNNSTNGCGPVKATPAIQGMVPPQPTHTVSINPLTGCVGGDATVVATATGGAFFTTPTVSGTTGAIADGGFTGGTTTAFTAVLSGSAGSTFNAALMSIRVNLTARNGSLFGSEVGISQYTFTLKAPGGQSMVLIPQGLGGNNLTNTTLLTQGGGAVITSGTSPYTGTFSPSGSAASLNGSALDGTWTIEVLDPSFDGTGGTMTSWSIQILGGSTTGSLPYSHSASGPGTIAAAVLSGNNANTSIGTIAVSDLIAGTNTFSVTTTANTGCSVTSSISMTTGAPLVLESVSGPASVSACAGVQQSRTSVVSGGGLPYTYVWTFDGDPVGDNSAELDFTPTADGDLVLTVTDDCGSVVTSSPFTYTIAPQPTLSLTQSALSICGGVPASVALNAITDGASVAWTPATGLSNANIANPTAAPASSTIYTVVSTGANGCITSGSLSLEVGNNPSGLTASSNITNACENGLVNLSSNLVDVNGPTGYRNRIGNNPNAVAIPDGTLFGNGAYIYSDIVLGNAGTNVVDANTTITVNLNISHSDVGDLQIALIAPNGATMTLSNENGGSGNNYTNTNFVSPSAFPSIISGSAPFTGNFKPEGATSALYGATVNGTWRLRIRDVNFISSGTLQNWSITVNFFGSSQSVDYVWTSAPNSFTSTQQNVTGVVVPATTVYTITATNESLCSTSATVQVNVEPLGIAINQPSFSVCAGVAITATSTTTGGGQPYTYAWTYNGNPVGTNSATLSGYVPTVSGTLQLAVTDNCATTETASVAVTVKPVPTATASANVACTGGTLELTGTTDIGTTYAWSGPASFNSAVQNPTISPVTLSNGGTYTFTTTYDGCASTPAAVNVGVNYGLSAVNVTPASPTICEGSSVVLTGSGGTGTGPTSVISGAGGSTTAAAVTGSTLGPNPFSSYYGGVKQQMMWRASELSAIGIAAGQSITSIAINLSNANTGYALQDLQVNVQWSSSINQLTGTFVTGGWTSVRAPATYTPTGTGYNTLVFSAPQLWNGTDNLLVEFSYSNNNSGGSSQNRARYDTGIGYTASAFYRADGTTSADMANATTATNTYASRNQVQFGLSSPASTYAWSPATGLSGTTGTVVTASPTVATTYTLTATSPNGCTASRNVNVGVNFPADPGTNGSTTVCSNGASFNLFPLLGGTPNAVGTWSGPSAITGDLFTPGTMDEGVYTYTVISDAPCAAVTATVTVTYDLTDTDGDGVIDCYDACPTFYGQPGDVCDANPDPNGFQLGVVTPACTCEPQNTTEDLVMVIQTDANPSEISWEITPDNNPGLTLCSGVAPAGAVNQSVFGFCSLPQGCFKLRVFDSGGDGFTVGSQGGYELRYSGAVAPLNDDKRIIDNSRNFNASFDGSLSAIGSGPSAFCLPMSVQKPLYHHRDRLDFVSNEYLVCDEDAAVSAQWQVGDQTLSGYQFWFFDPNGSYSYRRGRTHATSDNFGNVGATRACHMRINNWAVANQIPENVLMNVRIRTRVNGVYGEFGPAYRFKIDPVRAQCKLTKLLDYVESPFMSCNGIRSFGPNNYVHARGVPGANKYQFRFRIPAENFVVVRSSNTYFLQLNWATDPLVAGKTYIVDVRASKDGGATWCSNFIAPALNPWGDLCNLTIEASAQSEGQELVISGSEYNNAGLSMWPNPNRSEQLWLAISSFGDDNENVTSVNVDIYDMTGKRLVSRVLPSQGASLNTVLDLNGELAAGLYMVNVSAGSKTWNQRLVIAR